ncbi:MAG: GntR family transcriptional regulator [Bacilli bacterium]
MVEEIERYVVLGILKPKEQIMSIRDTALNLGINPNTVKKAYNELENEGIIYTISTKGTFIYEDTSKASSKRINEYMDDILLTVSKLEKLGVKKEDIIKQIR